jgi:hypothetical protein
MTKEANHRRPTEIELHEGDEIGLVPTAYAAPAQPSPASKGRLDWWGRGLE